MARWTASAKWAAGPALDGQCATLLGLALSEGLGFTGGDELAAHLKPNSTKGGVQPPAVVVSVIVGCWVESEFIRW